MGHVEKHGINVILNPFVKDLNRLATDGVSVSINGVTKVFRGTLIAFLADTQSEPFNWWI